jgi:hypothetical protein
LAKAFPPGTAHQSAALHGCEFFKHNRLGNAMASVEVRKGMPRKLSREQFEKRDLSRFADAVTTRLTPLRIRRSIRTPRSRQGHQRRPHAR